MNESAFIIKIFNTTCEDCPIQGYCKIAKTFSCRMTAKSFFNKVIKGKEDVAWRTLETALNLGLTPQE